MTKNEKRLLKFAIEYPGWHTCGRDTVPLMRRLAGYGLVEMVEYGRKALPQFRLALPDHARLAIDEASAA